MKTRWKDYTGQTFHRLTARNRVEDTYPSQWIFDCACGNTHQSRIINVTSGRTKSCGCYREQWKKSHEIPGHREDGKMSKTYRAWWRIKPELSHDSPWKNFKVFLADMGEKPASSILLRLDTQKPFSKDNCEWISYAIYHQRERIYSNAVMITHEGRTLTQSQWAKETGLSRQLIAFRMKKGKVGHDLLKPARRKT